MGLHTVIISPKGVYVGVNWAKMPRGYLIDGMKEWGSFMPSIRYIILTKLWNDLVNNSYWSDISRPLQQIARPIRLAVITTPKQLTIALATPSTPQIPAAIMSHSNDACLTFRIQQLQVMERFSTKKSLHIETDTVLVHSIYREVVTYRFFWDLALDPNF